MSGPAAREVPHAGSGPPVRIVLLGFMAAGKSTVGRLLAARLGWRFVDLDAEIERRTGRGVPELFAELGEPGFRALERESTAALAGTTSTVIAVGGGWITGPGNLEALQPGALTVWLQVTADTALARLEAEPGTRPLLAGPDPSSVARRLLRERTAHYRKAELHVPTDNREPEALAREIAEIVRARLARSGDETQESNG